MYTVHGQGFPPPSGRGRGGGDAGSLLPGDTVDRGDLQEYVRHELEELATCMDSGETDAPIPGVDASQPETACLKLAELPEAFAIVQPARIGASDSNRYSRASPGGKGKTPPAHGRQRVLSSARDQRHHDDRPGTDLQAKVGQAESSQRLPCVYWAGDPQCPGRLVNMIELEDQVQEFEPNQDAGRRQILSVQVDVSEVRSLRPSTRLVLAMNSMDVGRRERARGVIDTTARYTVAHRPLDRAFR